MPSLFVFEGYTDPDDQVAGERESLKECDVTFEHRSRLRPPSDG